MNPFNAWPDRLWIGKLTTCDVCYKDRIRAAMIIGNLDYDVDRVLCRDCVDTVLLAEDQRLGARPECPDIGTVR